MAPQKKSNPKLKAAKMAPKATAKAAIKSPQTHTITGPHHHHDGVCCAEDHSSKGAMCSTTCWPWSCPLFSTLTKPAFWLGSVVAFIVLMVFDMFWHGHIMMSQYQNTLHLWRPEAEVMAHFMVYCYIMHALAAAAITALVILIGRCDFWGGTVAGVLAMAPAAAYSFGAYIWTPFPTMDIPLMWAGGQLIEGALIGFTLTALFKAFPKLCPCTTCCK